VRVRMTPRDDALAELFVASAGHLVTGADLLAQLLGAEPADRAPLAERLTAAEQDGDEATHAILRRVDQTFVTPFDREDVYALASALDDCMDHMQAAGDLVVLHRVAALPAGVATQVAALQRAAELTLAAMPRLRTLRGLRDYWIEVNRLENEAGRAHRALVAELYDDPRSTASPAAVVDMLRVKGVVDTLELAADAFETVAHTVESIVLKDT
jgi:uncharacterized protein